MSSYKRLILVRHGETVSNRDRLMTGRIDTPLTAKGRKQARRAASRIACDFGKVDRIYASPLTRTMETARPLSRKTGVRPVREPLLIETNFGAWEGKKKEELSLDEGWKTYTADPFHYTFPEGESPQDVRSRALSFLSELRSSDGWESAVVFSHYTPVAFIVLEILGMADGARAPFRIDNGSLTVIALDEKSGYIVTLNSVCA